MPYMVLSYALSIADFLLPLSLLFVGGWLIQRDGLYSNPEKLVLSRRGTVAVITTIVFWFFSAWYIYADLDKNLLATWLGVNIRGVPTQTFNSIRRLLASLAVYSFFWYMAIAALRKPPFRFSKLLYLVLPVYITVRLILGLP